MRQAEREMTVEEGGEDGEGKTVIVGVKMDGQSKELLTWSLVKVADPGDLVIALHVLPTNDIIDQDGKSSLLSLVKAFDSVLAVYEGFCNLKQVDLKLKICRGSSIRKILVREANSYGASNLIVGTSAKQHTIRPSTSVAKYCAKKLGKECSVLAVRNGKVVYQRGIPLSSAERRKKSKGIFDHCQNGIMEALERASAIDTKLPDADIKVMPESECDQRFESDREKTDSMVETGRLGTLLKQNCAICSPNSVSSSKAKPVPSVIDEDNGKIQEEESIALVPFQKLEAGSSSISLLIKELPERRPGWPLLRRTLLSGTSNVSVVQWTMLLPARSCLSATDSCTTQKNCDQMKESVSFTLPDEHSDSIVAVGEETLPSCVHHESRSPLKELDGIHEKFASTCRLFKYEELKTATNNFMPENLIGKGGTSRVYRGSLSDGKELAVKILKPSENVLQEFVLEIEIITTLHHKNIISLFGFCFEYNNLLLVYDLLTRGSLEENLHGIQKNPAAFGWNERFKVALGVAEALDYLHNHSVQPVIHRDVKSSNILLSEDFEAQLSDFGLAKLASISPHIICTDVAGTFGYLAPEYFMYGKVTDKVDVYAYGVVLLELLSGRKPISDQPKGQESIVMWAKPILNGGKVSKLLDPCMGSNYNRDQIERMVLAATLCIRRAPRARPQISLILKLLQGDTDSLKWARLQVHASENCDMIDDDGHPGPDIQSHLSLALLDVEDDSLSVSSIEQHVSLEEYLRGRWSRSSSFD